MAVRLLRTFADRDSPIHALPAAPKLIVALVGVAVIAAVPKPQAPWTAVTLPLVLVLAAVARLPLGGFLARIALVLPFALGAAAMALFRDRALFVALAAKSTSSIAILQLLAQTTPFPRILGALRAARVPLALVEALALLHRYVFVVVEETERMRRARAARTWDRGRRHAWRGLAAVIAGSFVRSLDRAERVAAAMRARGGP